MSNEPPSDPKNPPLHILPLEPIGSGTAPFVYFDVASTFGFRDGVGNVTLEAIRHIIDDDGATRAERVVVAQLRMSLKGALALQDAMNSVVLQATPTASDAKN